jgi:hypothetical protein
MSKKNCKFPIVYNCPVCGLPIQEGKCKGGCNVEIRHVPLKELGEFLKDYNLNNRVITIIDKTEPYYPYEEQYATLEIRDTHDKPQKSIYPITIKTVMPLEVLKKGLYFFLIDYLYRRDCGIVEEVVQKHQDKHLRNEKKTVTLRITKNQYRFLKKGLKHYGYSASLLLDAYAMDYAEMHGWEGD